MTSFLRTLAPVALTSVGGYDSDVVSWLYYIGNKFVYQTDDCFALKGKYIRVNFFAQSSIAKAIYVGTHDVTAAKYINGHL